MADGDESVAVMFLTVYLREGQSGVRKVN